MRAHVAHDDAGGAAGASNAASASSKRTSRKLRLRRIHAHARRAARAVPRAAVRARCASSRRAAPVCSQRRRRQRRQRQRARTAPAADTAPGSGAAARSVAASASTQPMRAPASACAFDSVRSTTRFGDCAEQRAAATGASREFDVGLVDDHQRATAQAPRQRARCRPAAAPAPVGLPGEHRNTSLRRRWPTRVARARRSRSAKPCASSRSGTSITRRALQARADGVHAERRRRDRRSHRCPGRQNARTSRSMASSLPRPTSSCSGAHAVQLGQRSTQRRAAADPDSGASSAAGIGVRWPRRFVGVEPDRARASARCAPSA